jgi:hypothetical protein
LSLTPSEEEAKGEEEYGDLIDTYLDRISRRRVEMRLIMKNDGGESSPTDFTSSKEGKLFFGLTGFIESIDVYCKNTAGSAGNIMLGLTAYVGGALENDVTLTVPANTPEGWQNVKARLPWNFDRLFIYLKSVASGCSVGYDGEGEADSYGYDSATGKWYAETRRLYIRVNMTSLIPFQRIGGHVVVQDIERHGINVHIVDDADVTKSGTWTTVKHKEAVKGSFTQSATANDYVEITERMTAIWLRYRTETACTIDVVLDGVTEISDLDLSATVPYFDQIPIMRMTEGEHTVRIVLKSGTLSFDSFIYEIKAGQLQTWTMIESPVAVRLISPRTGTSTDYFYTYEVAPWAYWTGSGAIPSDRLLALIYGDQNLRAKQRTTGELLVQLNQAGSEVADANPVPVKCV